MGLGGPEEGKETRVHLTTHTKCFLHQTGGILVDNIHTNLCFKNKVP